MRIFMLGYCGHGQAQQVTKLPTMSKFGMALYVLKIF